MHAHRYSTLICTYFQLGCMHTQVFFKIFEGRCIRPDGSRSLFVDVGGNFGWFTVFAGLMGCR